MTTAQERETIINFCDEYDKVSIYTASTPVKHKCEKAGFTLVKTDKLAKTGEECSWWFECKRKEFKFGFRKKTVMTPERQETYRIRGEKMRAARQSEAAATPTPQNALPD